MPSTFASDKFAVLTANGTVDGLATIASNEGWLPGCVVWLAATGETSLEMTIVEQVGTTQIRLRAKDSKAKHGVTSISAYTTAKASSLSLEGQVVPVLAPYVPRERA